MQTTRLGLDAFVDTTLTPTWHKHKPFVGPRRVIQFNWVTSEGNRRIAMLPSQRGSIVRGLVIKAPATLTAAAQYTFDTYAPRSE
jgi:hypothetical protein